MRTRRNPPRRRRGRPWIRLALAALLAPGITPAAGEAPAPTDAPAQIEAASFFIETITVTAERLSPEIVLSESLLREGREYSEAQLREAVHRINRLPFVLLAEFSLRRGSERGLYELVIQVYEARRWFSQLALGIALNDPIDTFRIDDFGESFLRSEDGDNFDSLIGRRFAVGRRGLLFASFGTEAGLFAVGYQHYNLFDRNVLFSVTVAGENQSLSQSRAARAQLGIPIRGNHALRLLAGWSWFDYDSSFFASGAEIRETELEIAWVFNSLDDPVLPRDGTLFELGLAGSRRDDERDFLLFDGSRRRLDLSRERHAVVGSASRHWPVGARQSLSAGIGGFVGDRDRVGRKWQGEAGVGHQVFLLRNLEPGKWRELRFDTRLSAERVEYSSDLVAEGLPGGLDAWRLRAGLVYRNGWGIFQLFVEHLERSFE